MSYRDDATRLARALTDLLSTDPLPAEPLLAGQVQAALVCRDTVVGAVRDLTGALLGRTATRLPDAPDLLSRSPAHALHAALRDLPPATGRDLALTDALATGGGRPLPGWQHAARAATALEAYRDDAAALPGPARPPGAWPGTSPRSARRYPPWTSTSPPPSPPPAPPPAAPHPLCPPGRSRFCSTGPRTGCCSCPPPS